MSFQTVSHAHVSGVDWGLASTLFKFDTYARLSVQHGR